MDGVGIIYRHVYTVDGRSYIGQSINGIHIRNKSHKKSKDETHFHRAIRKYGWDKFTTEILHENIDPMYLDEWEIYYISKYDTYGENGFNMTSGGNGIRGYKHTDEHKHNLSNKMKGVNNHFYGRSHSDETRDLISESRRAERNPNFGKQLSIEHRTKIGKSHFKSVQQWSHDGNTLVNVYKSIDSAATAIGRSASGISQCLRGVQKTSGGFVWKLSN